MKIADPALNVDFWDKVTDVLVYSPADIKKITTEALMYPHETRKQFGFLEAATTPVKKQKQKQPKSAANKKPKLVPPSPVASPTKSPINSGTGTGSNSVHCVNHAASLMASQWPTGAPPPAGCHPNNGKPCTRSHAMPIVSGTPIDKGLVNDLLNGIDGFRNASVFANNFKITLKAWH